MAYAARTAEPFLLTARLQDFPPPTLRVGRSNLRGWIRIHPLRLLRPLRGLAMTGYERGTYTTFFVSKYSSEKKSLILNTFTPKPIVRSSSSRSPPLSARRPLESTLVPLGVIFLLTHPKSREIPVTARHTTKSAFSWRSSSRSCRALQFVSPVSLIMASVTLIFFAMESTRINWEPGNRMARGIPGNHLLYLHQ